MCAACGYPGSKFVLTLRDEEKWYRSVNRHIGDLRSAHHEWIYGRGKGLPMDDKENTIAVYRKHNEEVKAYFKDRPDDFIIIDCAPSLGLITLNALVSSDAVIIPIQCEYFALEGLGKLLNTIKSVQKLHNKDLEKISAQIFQKKVTIYRMLHLVWPLLSRMCIIICCYNRASCARAARTH